MQAFQDETNNSELNLECADLLMEVAPVIMSAVRKEMHAERLPGLTIPQLRILIFTFHNEGASISQIAEHMGLGLPTVSKIVNTLVSKKLVTRRTSLEDRRYVRLGLSNRGRERLTMTRKRTVERLARITGRLQPKEQGIVIEAMKVLNQILTPERTPVYSNLINRL